MGPAHYKDLREAYCKRMEVHGLGVALFHPIASQDMRPPCCGYFDRNGDWNLICSLLPQSDPPFYPPAEQEGYEPLDYTPQRSCEINIEWQPKTANGTQEHVMAGNAETPDTLPGGAGAEANVRYSSKGAFGGVLMTKKPIKLTAYNDERLFRDWLEANRGILYDRHGAQLRKYGMWLVTRTYTCRGCSINAWSDASKMSVISTKAKAAMLGELGEELNWNDRLSSRDWSHYNDATGEGLVVFMDGIDLTGWDWVLEGVRQKVPKTKERDRALSRRRQADQLKRQRASSVGGVPRVSLTTTIDQSQQLDAPKNTSPRWHHRGGVSRSEAFEDGNARRDSADASKPRAPPPRQSDKSHDTHLPLPQYDGVDKRNSRRVDSPMRRSAESSRHRSLSSRQSYTVPVHDQYQTRYGGVDDNLLKDIGLKQPLSRSVSPMSVSMRGSLKGSPGPARSLSLRRETRSISLEHDALC